MGDNTNADDINTEPTNYARTTGTVDAMPSTSSTSVNMPVETARSTSSSNADHKRSAVNHLIERYFYQLQLGCGNSKCSNKYCFSSGQVAKMSANEIAAMAIQLFSQDAKLCDVNKQSPKLPLTEQDSADSQQALNEMPSPIGSINGNSQSSSSSSSTSDSASSTATTADSQSLDSNQSFSGASTSHHLLQPTQQQQLNVVDAHYDLDDDDYAQMEIDMDNGMGLTEHTGCIEGAQNTTSNAVNSTTNGFRTFHYLDEEIVDKLIAEYEATNNPSNLLNAINQVFSAVNKLGRSFPLTNTAAAATKTAATASQSATTSSLATNYTNACSRHKRAWNELLHKAGNVLKKEDIRILQGEIDKDEDSSLSTAEPVGAEADSINMEMMQLEIATARLERWTNKIENEQTNADAHVINGDSSTVQQPAENNGIAFDSTNKHLTETNTQLDVDLPSLRRVKQKLFNLKNCLISDAIHDNIMQLAEFISTTVGQWRKLLNCLVICFDITTNSSNRFTDLEYMERTLPKLCHATHVLPITIQARLARIWARYCQDELLALVQCCQQVITLQTMVNEETVQYNIDVIAVIKVLKIAYYANILAGECEAPNKLWHHIAKNNETKDTSPSTPNEHMQLHIDLLEKELNISVLDCRKPVVGFDEFYNELLSDCIKVDHDYLTYRKMTRSREPDEYFCYSMYSYILTPSVKVIWLYYDSRIKMYSGRASTIHGFNSYADISEMGYNTDLKVKVRRDHLIDDALINLEMVAMSNPKDLKKQLVVEFDGEQGIDEGGVSKEFFQLVVEELFNADYGMFIQQKDTNTVWFNSMSFENASQFTLVGIILGLAIYNNIILAVKFPMVVYRKLMGAVGTFYDLPDWNPTIYNSLKSMLDYEGADMEDTYDQTFNVCYTNMFGEACDYELKPGGANIYVNQQNKHEFVELYCDYLLNQNIESQFDAFKKGFEMVTDESPLRFLFRPEEVELLVCGSPRYDFNELEKSASYDGGYTADCEIIKDFWSIVHDMPDELKRKLLQFTTGSDRVPVGGLKCLKLRISRNGTDSERLPTAHTCFNILLLPEYKSKEKLEERLLKAINYAKGFGML